MHRHRLGGGSVCKCRSFRICRGSPSRCGGWAASVLLGCKCSPVVADTDFSCLMAAHRFLMAFPYKLRGGGRRGDRIAVCVCRRRRERACPENRSGAFPCSASCCAFLLGQARGCPCSEPRPGNFLGRTRGAVPGPSGREWSESGSTDVVHFFRPISAPQTAS